MNKSHDHIDITHVQALTYFLFNLLPTYQKLGRVYFTAIFVIDFLVWVADDDLYACVILLICIINVF